MLQLQLYWKIKKYTNVGVLNGPPPMPKKLDINPNITFTLVLKAQ